VIIRPLCKVHAALPFDEEPRRSSVSTKLATGASRCGGQEPAVELQFEGSRQAGAPPRALLLGFRHLAWPEG
jgi:hypothetical protein